MAEPTPEAMKIARQLARHREWLPHEVALVLDAFAAEVRAAERERLDNERLDAILDRLAGIRRP